MQHLDESTFAALKATDPEWLAERRQAGYEYFEKLSMPSSKEEAWKYVDLDFDLADFGLADGGEPLGAEGGVPTFFERSAGSATIVNGLVGPVMLDEPKVTFSALREVGGPAVAVLHKTFGTAVAPDLDIFAAAHRAFGRDGLFLSVPDGVVVTDPFVIDVQATESGTVSFPHITVTVGEDAEVSVVVGMRSPDGTRIVVNPHIEAFVGDAGRLRLSTYQQFGDETRAVIHERVQMAKDASSKLGEVGLGGRLGRTDLDLGLIGDGSSTNLVGIYYGEHEQVLDYRLLMHHVGRSTSSDVFLKGAVQDTAESAFIGLVKIEHDAAKTSAFETNRNLVLSEGATANSVPNLEILCDDVVCGHGSTVGPLDEEPLYYLMSRGLSYPRASRLLVHGFFEEALGRLPHPELEAPARAEVDRRYVTAQEQGRV